MELFEYIKSQLPQMPNVQIMKDLGASDVLVEYVKESPENTNLNVMETLGCGGGSTGEVWATSENGELGLVINENEASGDGSTTKGYADWSDLFNNPQNYTVKAHFEFPTSSLNIDIEGTYDAEDEVYEIERQDGYSGYLCEVGICKDETKIEIDGSGSYSTDSMSEECTSIEIIVTKK